MTSFRTRLPSPSRFFFAAFSAILIWVFSACSDSPDKTGLSYLQSQNVKLSTPLYHFTFKNLTVDSLFATEAPLNHFGESLLVVGRDGPFTAAVRMGFQINTQALRDSLAHGLNLRLVALPTVFRGYNYLQSSTASHDSLSLLVESFAWNDSAGHYSDSQTVFNNRIISGFLPYTTFESRYKVRDTVRIAVAAAYSTVRDTMQVCALPNLKARVHGDTVHNWQLYLEISPLVKTGAAQDSGMFRFAGLGGTYYNPGLWLGHYREGLIAGATPSPTLVSPYGWGGLPAVNYQVKHSGSDSTLLYGISRAINFRLNRDSLLNRIRDTLAKIDTALVSKYLWTTSGKYDSRFFVPYAEVHFPIDASKTRVNGNFALDMQLISEVDSLDPQSSLGLIPVNTGDSLTLYPTQAGAANYTGSTDTLTCYYRKAPADTSLRQVILHWKKDAVVDTFLLAPEGKRRQLALKRHSGWLRPATLGVYPHPDRADIEVYFNVGSGIEPNAFENASVATPTAPRSVSGRYLLPGAATLNLRATRGVSAVLNRASGVTPGLYLRPSDRNAFDSTYATDSTFTSRITFPVFGEVGFSKTGGKHHVDIDIYLYPLRKGQ